MEKIRKGNDIEVQWAIYVGKGINEAPYDLTGKKISLYLKNSFGTTEIYDFSVDKHVISFMYWGKNQKQTGIYSIVLVENEGREGMHTVDECDAFSLVNHSCETGGESEGRVECVHLQFRSNMGVFVPTIGASIEVDDTLSLFSENPVQNKVITLALQQEISRAVDAEARLERLYGDFDKKVELIEDSVDVLDKTVQQMIVKSEVIDTKLEMVNKKLDALDLESVENVLTKVETIEADLSIVKKALNDVDNKVDALDAKVDILEDNMTTVAVVDNKIANALAWEEIQ